MVLTFMLYQKKRSDYLLSVPKHLKSLNQTKRYKLKLITMYFLTRGIISCAQMKLLNRSFACTPALETKEWRVQRGLPVNKTAEGMLTDTPDYTFLDGRPTPLLHKQKLRMLKQQEYASTIVGLSAELDFAKKRRHDMLKAEEEERNRIIQNRLKPKGNALPSK